MESATSKLRKAALIIASLDRETADRLLDQMPDTSSRMVRNMLLELSSIDRQEQQAAIHDFLSRDLSSIACQPTNRISSERWNAGPRESRGSVNITPSPSGDDLVGALERAPERTIADCLRQETPQAIAVALASLPTDRASEVISHLPNELQTEVLERLVEYDPAIALEWVEIREEFHQWFNEQLEQALHRTDLAARLASILEASHPGTREKILINVSSSDERLARELQQQFDLGTVGDSGK